MKWLTTLMMLFVAGLGLCDNVFADGVGDVEGHSGGNTGGNNSVSCDSSKFRGYQKLCGDGGSEGGGVAWRIYRVDGSSAPAYDTQFIPNQVSAATMRSTCANFEFFAVLGWEGKPLGDNNFYGPVAENDGKIKNASQNNYNAQSFQGLQESIRNNSYPDNLRLSFSAANALKQIASQNGHPVKSDVGYMCISVSDIMGVQYYAQSQVSNRATEKSSSDLSDYVGTSIVESGGNLVTRQTEDIELEIKDGVEAKANLTFSHNVYANKPDEDISWSVDRTMANGQGYERFGFGGGGLYTITGLTNSEYSRGDLGGTTSGTAKTNENSKANAEYKPEVGEYYFGETRGYKDAKEKYILRDFYTVTFLYPGKYTFCETMKIGGTPVTKVCSTVNVKGKETPPPDSGNTDGLCAQWKNSTYSVKTGTTSIRWYTADTRDVYGNEVHGSEISDTSSEAYQNAIRYLEVINGLKTGLNSNEDYTYAGTTESFGEDIMARIRSNLSGSGTTGRSAEVKVLSKVRNLRRDGSNWIGDYGDSISNNTTYARPGDTVEWVHCYYPDIQELAYLDDLTKIDEHNGHCSHGDNSCANNNETFADYLGEDKWQNQYSIETKEILNTDDPNAVYSNEIDYYLNSNKSGGVGTDSNKIREAILAYKGPSTVVASTDATTSGPTLSTNPTTGWPWYVFGVKIKIGDSSSRYSPDKHEMTLANDVGRTYRETITSGTPIAASIDYQYHAWTCPSPCGGEDEPPCSTCTHTNAYGTGSYTTGNVTSFAQAAVPYNYENDVSFGVNVGSGSPVYAGETITVNNARAYVNMKYNSLVRDSYTTQVDDAEVRMVFYVTDQQNGGGGEIREVISDPESGSGNRVTLCGSGWFPQKQCAETIADDPAAGSKGSDYAQNQRTILNKDGALTGFTYNPQLDGTYNVFDASAGDYLCIRMAVYPASSGDDGNLMRYGDATWKLTAPECRVIAKRPSMQVLGGSVFSNGSMTANVSTKNNLWGYDGPGEAPYRLNNEDTDGWRTRFGTWVEEAIVANGSVERIASGAALGYDFASVVGIGEENSTLDFCQRWVPLTFANYSSVGIGIYPCSNGTEFAGLAGVYSPTSNRSALVDYWNVGAADKRGEVVVIDDLSNSGRGDIKSLTNRDIRVINVVNGVQIGWSGEGESIIRPGQTRVVSAGYVHIRENIRYADDRFNALESAGDVPQVIIYSKGDIDIACDVEQIDAILIAKGTVNTCYRGVANSLDAGAHPLTIRGMVIANKVEATREYGNGVGDHSGDPAETINYDTSALVWGRYMAGSGESNTLTLTYQHELAPRL